MEKDQDVRASVLLAEDEKLLAEWMTSALERAGYRVHGATTVSGAIGILECERRYIDVVLLDYCLADGTAEPVMKAVLDLRLDAALVLVTGGALASLHTVAGLRWEFVLNKPFSAATLVEFVECATSIVRSRRGEAERVHDDWPRRWEAVGAPTRPARMRSVVMRGEVIKRSRLSRGWTQEDLAERAGVSVKTVASAETGHSVFARTGARIANALGLPADVLLT
jgi:DNA-binding NtrC family response regulator